MVFDIIYFLSELPSRHTLLIASYTRCISAHYTCCVWHLTYVITLRTLGFTYYVYWKNISYVCCKFESYACCVNTHYTCWHSTHVSNYILHVLYRYTCCAWHLTCVENNIIYAYWKLTSYTRCDTSHYALCILHVLDNTCYARCFSTLVELFISRVLDTIFITRAINLHFTLVAILHTTHVVTMSVRPLTVYVRLLVTSVEISQRA